MLSLLQDLDAAEQENRDFWGALATVAKAQVAAATRQDEVDRCVAGLMRCCANA